MKPLLRFLQVLALLGLTVVGGSSCGSSEGTVTATDGVSTDPTLSASVPCADLTGTAWTPSVPGISSSYHDSTVTLSQSTIQTSGLITGLAQAAPISREIAVTVDMNQDLGPLGSLTLMAQVNSFPASLSGSAFAYLVSLSDGTNEYIHLARAGTGGDCAAAGYYQCSSSVCTANTSCTISAPSAFVDRTHWEQHQTFSNSAENSPSINIFPTCNWTAGSNSYPADPSCAFNSTFFASSPSRLRYGVNYTARYILLADSYSTLGLSYTAGLTVTVVKKTNPKTSPGGAVDVNFILVGADNVQASRTTKGKQNLNTLAAAVVQNYSQSNMNLKIGTVRGFEWGCASGGDDVADIVVSDIGTLFAGSGALLSSTLATQAVNVFLVNTIQNDSSGSNSNLTILGIDGAIGGPVVNGTAVSGLAVSTFGDLDGYNPHCSTSVAVCPLTQQEESFFQLGDTVTHEMGHYFGLNHLSESSGATHDLVQDTPICTQKQSVSGSQYITLNSCRTLDTNIFSGTSSTCNANCGGSYSPSLGQFCATATACEFNYTMWWTSKNFNETTGASDGSILSQQEAGIINYHPLVQ